PAMSMVVSSYKCPSGNLGAAEIGYCNYRACFGTMPPPSAPNGAFYMNSAISDQNIKDGSSSTILFGEAPFGFWADALSCCARVPRPPLPPNGNANDQRFESPARPAFDWFSQATPQSGNFLDVVSGQATGGPVQFSVFGFGSPHPGSVMFAMADGSQRPINKSINLLVLEALATISGNERVGDDF